MWDVVFVIILKSHFTLYLFISATMGNVIGFLCCNLCNLSGFVSSEAWKAHQMTLHKDDIVAMCEACCKTFKSVLGYRNHNIKYHSTESEMYKCQKCGKRFVSKCKLSVHQSVHSDDKPYRCTTCENSYKYKSDLKKHEQLKHNMTEVSLGY